MTWTTCNPEFHGNSNQTSKTLYYLATSIMSGKQGTRNALTETPRKPKDTHASHTFLRDKKGVNLHRTRAPVIQNRTLVFCWNKLWNNEGLHQTRYAFEDSMEHKGCPVTWYMYSMWLHVHLLFWKEFNKWCRTKKKIWNNNQQAANYHQHTSLPLEGVENYKL